MCACSVVVFVVLGGCQVLYLNNANACLDYVVGAGDTDEFSDAKSVVKQICLDW